MQCALQLFAARGYEAVGVQEIVDTAGVTKPTLYHYFGSKQGLLEALLKTHLDPFDAALQEAAHYQGDLPLTLFKVVSTCFQFARTDKLFYRVMLALWFAPPGSEANQVVSQQLFKLYQPLEVMFQQAVKNHGNMRGRHQRLAATLQGIINTYVGLALNGYVELDEAMARTVVHQFSHGIYS
jgi:TetR/AcrR family transcriptional regulator